MVYGDTIIDIMVADGRIKNTYEGAINPASINIRLGNTFLVPKPDQIVTLGGEVQYDEFNISDSEKMIINAGEFMLATTKEWIDVPITAVAFVQGRSSIGRACLSIQNAGFVDPGFKGHITLELKNDGPFPIELIPGYPVGQLVYMECHDTSEGYNGKYLGQVEATGSRMQDDILKPGNQKEVNVE